MALQRLNVVICLDRAGLVGADGATHHGAFDIAALRPIPNLTIASPADEVELRNLMYTAQLPDRGPFVIRYPRGSGTIVDWRRPMTEIAVGRGRCLRPGTDVALLTLGPIGMRVAPLADTLAAEGISVAHYDMRFAKPLDEEMLHDVLRRFGRVLTVEDGVLTGGIGTAVLEFASLHGYSARIRRIGLPDRFVEHGSVDELYAECGMDNASIAQAIRQLAAER